MKKNNFKKKGFTLIELVIVIALIAILAVTLSISIIPIINNSKVSRTLHYLSMIRSKISYSAIYSNEYPDLASNDPDLLYKMDVHPTEAFSYGEYSGEETDKIVSDTGDGSGRDYSGGWYYIRETGEIYANLPNGAYTGNEEKEIWNEDPFIVSVEYLRNLGIEVDEYGNYDSNGDFEVFDGNINNWKGFDPSKIGNWNTEDSNRNIELWRSGFQGVDAVSGNYFMELNSNGKNSIYQDLEVVPGTTIEWSVSHRGRSGEDTAAIRIGSGDNESITNITTGKDGWKEYKGTYEVPEGQTTLRIYIDSVDSAGNDSVGNFIDNFNVGVKLD